MRKSDLQSLTATLYNTQDYFVKIEPEVVGFLANKKPGKFLDVSCGPKWILSALNSDCDRHGVEISKFASETH